MPSTEMVKGWGLLVQAKVRQKTRNGTVTWIRPLSMITLGRCSVSQLVHALFSHMGRNRATPSPVSTSGPSVCPQTRGSPRTWLKKGARSGRGTLYKKSSPSSRNRHLAMQRFPLPSIALVSAVIACSNGSAAGNSAAKTADSAAKAAAVSAAVNATAQPGAAPTRDSLTDAADRGRILGKESAPVWFVMVSDFQCPFCKTWHDSTFRMIEKDYVETGKLRMAFINFPLHANSLPASV